MGDTIQRETRFGIEKDYSVSHMGDEVGLEMKSVRPKFENPPIVEQALSVVFEKISGFGTVDLGLFWSEVKDRFPNQAVAPRLPISQEAFDTPVSAGFEFSVGAIDVPRLMLDNGKGELIQVQDDRFSFNWAKQPAADYPHSEVTVSSFREFFGLFSAYLEGRGLPPPALVQCEITNLNIIPVAEFGSDYADVHLALKLDPLDLGVEFLVAETYVRNRQHRILDEQLNPIGRLHTAISPVVNAVDGSKAFRLELTARSAPNVRRFEEALSFFDIARNAINSGFLGIVTDNMRKKWREING